MPSNSSLFYQRGEALAVGKVFLFFSCGQLLALLWVWGKWGAEGVPYSEVVKVDRVTGDIHVERHILGTEVLVLMTTLVLAQLFFDAILLHGVRLSPSSTARCCIFAWLVFRALLFGIITLVVAFLLHHAAHEDEYLVSIQKFGASTLSIIMIWYGWAVELSFYRRLRFAHTEAVSRDWEQTGKALTGKQGEKTPTEAPLDEDPKMTAQGKA